MGSKDKKSKENKYLDAYNEFIKKYRVDRGHEYTHFSPKPYGRYNIPENKLKKFYKKMRKANLRGHKLNVIEKTGTNSNLFMEVRLSYRDILHKRRYTSEIVKNVNDVIIQITNNYIKTEKKNEYVWMECDTPREISKEVVEDKFIIRELNNNIPNELKYVIYDEVRKELTESKIFAGLDLVNQMPNIINNEVIEKGIVCYENYSHGKKYEPTYVYNGETIDKYSNEGTIDEYQKFSLIDNENKGEFEFVSSEKQIEFHQKYRQLNINSSPIDDNDYEEPLNINIAIASDEDLENAKVITKLLKKTRIIDKNVWLTLGSCLHNIDNRLLDTWIEVSIVDDLHNEYECEEEWRKFKKNNFSLETLYRWLQEDDPKEYNIQLFKKVMPYIRDASTERSTYKVARAFYELFKSKFACASIKPNLWYFFNGNRWESSDGAYKLTQCLNQTFYNTFAKWHRMLKNNMRGLEEREEKEHQDRLDSCKKIMNMIHDSGYKQKILKECESLFYNPHFLETLDTNRDLIGFENGVYDLKEMRFRKGIPEDYLTLSTKINYIPYNEKNPRIKQVMDFFRQIQPEPEMHNFLLDFFASCIQGHIPDEKFYIFTGSGSNGKSIVMTLFMNTLGDYACNMATTLITSKRADSNTPTPDIAKLKGKRFCVIQEPEQNDRIYEGKMKELTGGDRLSGRQLHCPLIEFDPQFKLVMTCNTLPNIMSNDGGTWRRIRVVDFIMKFVDNPDPKQKNQRKKDYRLKKRLEYWREALMAILIHRFRNYKINGIKEPEQIKLSTEAYKNESDIYAEYFHQNIEKTESKRDKIHIDGMYENFKDWFKESYPDRKSIGKTKFKNEIHKVLGSGSGLSWKGYRFKIQEGEDDGDESDDEDSPQNETKKTNNSDPIDASQLITTNDLDS